MRTRRRTIFRNRRHAASPGSQASTPVVTVSQPVISYSGIEKAALLRVRPGRFGRKAVEFPGREHPGVEPEARGPNPSCFSRPTPAGRIYRLEGERRVSLVAQAEQDQITKLSRDSWRCSALDRAQRQALPAGRRRRTKAPTRPAVYDSGGVSQWGRLSWRGTAAEGSSVRFQTRTGNSGRPDATWSDWSEMR